MEKFILENLNDNDLHKVINLYGEMEKFFIKTNKFMTIEEFANDYLTRCEMCNEIVFDDETDYRLNWEEKPTRMCRECQEEHDKLDNKEEDDRSDYEYESYRDYKLEN